MSSILDALRKVEEEREAAAGNADANLNEAVAEKELYGDEAREFKLTPAMMAIGVVCLTVVVAAVSVVVVVNALSGQQQSATQPVAAATPAPEPVAPAPTPDPEPEPLTAAPEPEPVVTETESTAEEEEEAAPEPIRVASVEVTAPTPPPRRETAPPAPAMEEPAPVVTQPEPEPEPVQPQQTIIRADASTASTSRATTPRAWQPPPTMKPDAGESDGLGDIALLPRLSPAVKSRYQLTNKKLMMPRPDSKPRQSALIDRVEVYVGERISGSNATLIGVDSRGVAIEIMGTGERYYWRMGS